MPLPDIYRLLLVLLVAGSKFGGTNLSIKGVDAGCFGSCCGSNRGSSDDDKVEVITGEKFAGKVLSSNQHPTEVKVTTEGSSSENNTNKYKVYKKDNDDSYKYVFNTGVKCTKIAHGDNEVWKRENSDDPVLESFIYKKDTSFTVYRKEDYSTISLFGGQWQQGQWYFRSSR